MINLEFLKNKNVSREEKVRMCKKLIEILDYHGFDWNQEKVKEISDTIPLISSGEMDKVH